MIIQLFVMNNSEGLRTLTSCDSGVMALAITPPGVFGDLPNCGKVQTEVRDRTVARAGPHSRSMFSALEIHPSLTHLLNYIIVQFCLV